MAIPDPFAEQLAAMTRAERLAWMTRYPAIRPEDIPASWFQAAMDNYSMHGDGLLHNILAGVAPLIAAAERARIRSLAEDREATAWSAPLDANECSRVPFADLIAEDSTDG